MAKIQEFIHLIEEGRWAKGVRIAALCAISFFLLFLFTLDPFYRGYFKGITHPAGMEEAALAKQIASGNGMAAVAVRPLALAQMKHNEIAVPDGTIADTYNAPVWPAVQAPVMLLFKSKWELPAGEGQYFLDRVVIVTSALFFFLGVWINYYTIRRLFDEKLALMVVCLTLFASIGWTYMATGLPQLWLFFLFSLVTYTLVRALEAESEGSRPERWLILASVGFGLLTLSHAICFALFLGATAYFVTVSRQRVRLGFIMGGVFLLCVAPWLVRNWTLSGNPFGVGIYSLAQFGGEDTAIMRRLSLDGLSLSPLTYRVKVQSGIQKVIAHLYSSFGGVIPACIFLLAFLHRYRNPVVSRLRLLLLFMWGAAVVGMAYAGFDGPQAILANDLTLLFLPIFAAFGMAYLLVQWGRMEIGSPFLRRGFIGLIFVVSVVPLLNMLAAGDRAQFFMPYRSPSIAHLATVVKPDEIVVSDMPWAVAWYANRTSLLLPIEPAQLIEMHDYSTLKRPIVGLFLTGISTDTPFLSGVMSPEYRGWYGLLRRDPNATSAPNLRGFPFPSLYVSEYFGYDCFYTDAARANALKLESKE